MTRSTNARIAGFTFLVYIAAGVSQMALGGATAPDASAAKLVRIVLELLANFSALVLAVTLYAITRDQDRDIAMLAMVCRVCEGVIGTMPGTMLTSATFFAVGSTLFAWLLLRGRMIPVPLAGLGVFASVLLVVGLPMQRAGFFGGRVAWAMWMPMLAFEVPLALWLIVKGVTTAAAPSSAPGPSRRSA
ncbi:MAG: DUF4386 family protein [Gemmatimonadales bacterium]